MGALERIACRMAHIAVRVLFTPERIAHGFDSAATMANNDKMANEMMAPSYAAIGPYARRLLIPSVEINFEGCSFLHPRILRDICVHSMATHGINCRPKSRDAIMRQKYSNSVVQLIPRASYSSGALNGNH